MGRPLPKRYFGNENTNDTGHNQSTYSNSSHEGIGGQGVTGFAASNGGNYINRLPTIATFSAPTLPGGQQATGVVHSNAQNASPNAKGTGYQIGDILTDANGSRWKVVKLRVVSATLNPSGTNSIWDGTEWIVWDQFINSHWTSPTILKGVTANGSHQLTGYNAGISTYGVWDGTDGTLAPTTAQTIVAGPGAGSMTPNYNTRASGDYNGSGTGDNNGGGGSVTFTYGVEAVVLVSSIDYAYGTSYAFGSADTTTDSGSGTGAKLDVGFCVSYLQVTDPGSGYIGTETITFSTAPNGGEIRAVGTLTYTTDDGRPYDAEAFPAIIAYAKTTSGGTNKIADINKQQSTRKYKVTTTDGTAFCTLKAGAPTTVGEMSITATDSSGKTYYVTKITRHLATLTPYGSSGWEFSTDSRAQWVVGTATPVYGVSVKLQSA